MFPTVSIHHQCTALPDTVLHQSPYTHSPLTGRRTTNSRALDPRGKQEVDPVEMDPTSDSPALSGDTNTCPRKNTFRDRIAALLTCPESNQMKNCSWREKRSYTATLREYPFNVSFFVSIFTVCNVAATRYCFYTCLSVILFTGGGGVCQTPPWQTPPWPDAPGRYPPGRHP